MNVEGGRASRYNGPAMKDEPRRVVVFGAGAIGSVVAAVLHERLGERLLLVARRDHVEAINVRGLRVAGRFPEPVFLRAVESLRGPLDDTLLVLTVKAVDLAAALRLVAPLLRPSTHLLLLQNGYGIREAAIAALAGSPVPAGQVYRGLAAIGSDFEAPGLVRSKGGGLRLEPAFFASPYASIFAGAELRVEKSRDFERDLWTKLLINCVINPLSLLLRANNLELAEERFDALKKPILDEGLAVAAAGGLHLDVSVPFINGFVSSANPSSMLQDFKRGRPTEIDFLNGALVRLGAERGVPTPVNAFLAGLVRAVERRDGASPASDYPAR